MSNNEKRFNFLRRSAKETMRYKTTMKILGTALALIAIFTVVMYASATLYKKNGSFTISIDRFEMTKYGLTLFESQNSSFQSSYLNAQIAKDITNIAGEEIPDDVDGDEEGAHNGENYIAYTFYLKNAGEVDVSYEYAVEMSNISNGLDEAIRCRLYVNGVPTTYAKTASDGSGPEPGTVEFDSATAMVRGRQEAFAVGDVTKFTVVVWIEGSDPDCVDWLIGGQMKIDMKISVIH